MTSNSKSLESGADYFEFINCIVEQINKGEMLNLDDAYTQISRKKCN